MDVVGREKGYGIVNFLLGIDDQDNTNTVLKEKRGRGAVTMK